MKKLLFLFLVSSSVSADMLSGALQGLSGAASDVLDIEIRRAQQLEMMQKQHDLEMERIQRMEEIQIRAEKRAAQRYEPQEPRRVYSEHEATPTTGNYCIQLSDGQHCY